MNVSLTPDLEALINEKVQSGLYDSPSEVVREGLELLKTRDQFKELRREELRREVQKGADDIKAGRYITLETPQDFADFAESIKREGLERLKQRRGERETNGNS